MTLPSGSRLGPSEIVAPIGAGGMGEFYRARDVRLEWNDAIRVLPDHLGTQPITVVVGWTPEPRK